MVYVPAVPAGDLATAYKMPDYEDEDKDATDTQAAAAGPVAAGAGGSAYLASYCLC